MALPEAECLTVDLPVEAALAIAFDRLERYEGPDPEPAPLSESSMRHAQSARLYAAALSYTDMLYARTQRSTPRGEALLERAVAMRETLRAEVRALQDENLLTKEAAVPKRRGASPQAVGLELLELVRFGEATQKFCSPEEWNMELTMFDAQLVGERLLTSIGHYDAPPIVRKIRDDRRRIYTLFVRAWNALRAAAIAELGQEEGDRVAPALG